MKRKTVVKGLIIISILAVAIAFIKRNKEE